MSTPMKSAANPPLLTDYLWTFTVHDVDADKTYAVTTVTGVSFQCGVGAWDWTLKLELLDVPSVSDLSEIDPKNRLTGLYLGFESGVELGPFYFDADNGIEKIPAEDERDLDRIIWRLHGPFRYRGES